MSSNKYIRHQSVVSRHSEESIDEDNWLNRFQKTLEKSAVQPRSVDNSLFNQINSIMNGNSKFSTVADAVEDMKQRSGLTDYLNKLNKVSKQEVATKTAQDNVNSATPTVIQKVPAIKQTIENYIRDTKGNLPVPAIVDKIRSIHQNDVGDSKDWDDEKLLRFISHLNLKAKQNNPNSYENHTNLGTRDVTNQSDIDPSNTDAFYGLNPVKY
jgi:uncharacterized protein YdiU (UPF0061 family)